MRLFFTVPDTPQTQNGVLLRNFLRQCAVFAVAVERDTGKVVPVVIRQVPFERFSHAFLPLSVVMIFSTFCAENKKTPLHDGAVT